MEPSRNPKRLRHGDHPVKNNERRQNEARLEKVERRRLTQQQRQDRLTSSTELQRMVTDLASIFGWEWVHFRAAKTQHGWKVPLEGSLGKGWPDLFMIRERDQRRMFVELKRELGDEPTITQKRIHETLANAGLPVFVWRPSDLSEGRVEEVLR